MKKNKTFFNKKKLLFGIFGATLLATPLFLTSCSSTLIENTIKNSISKGNGDAFTSNLSLQEVATSSLKNQAGYEAFIQKIANALSLQWIEYSAKQDNQVQYKNSLNEKRRTNNEEYDDLVDKYKLENKKDWEILFQQKELDPNGGTETTWKDKKMQEWAKEELKTKLFAESYFTLVYKDGSKVENNPSQETIISALKGNSGTNGTTSDWRFGFNEKAISSNRYQVTHADIQYAKFQQFIFDKWVENENPYVINMSLWKYGTPPTSNGVSDYYNVEAPKEEGENNGDTQTQPEQQASLKAKFNNQTREGENNGEQTPPEGEGGGDGEGETTPTASSGSYSFPYFQEPTTNDNNATTTKYKNFVNAAKTQNNFEFNTELGLKRIDKAYTEDSSTFILAKNGSIYNDLYTEFAAASAYLYGSGLTSVANGNGNTKAAPVAKKNISKNITPDTASNYGLDIITKEFISDTSFKTAAATPAPKADGTTANGSDLNETLIDKSLVKKIVKDDENNPLYSMISANKDFYTIDAFQVGDAHLNKFMMLRNEAGVHAISIDGDTYINKATSTADAKKRAGDIVMYHAMMGKNYADANQGFTIDLKNELSTYFSSHADTLIIEYALKTYNENTDTSNTTDKDKQQMFNLKELFGDTKYQSYQTFLKAVVDYIWVVKLENRQVEFVQKMVEAKAKYSSNFGVDTYKNGFASQWIYFVGNTSHLKIYNQYFGYDLTNVLKPIKTSDSETATYTKAVDTFINANPVAKQTSNFKGYKYSEYIYSDNPFINAAIDGYASSSDNLGIDVKTKVLEKYIGNDFFDFTNYQFKENNSLIGANGNAAKLDSAFANYEFGKPFSDKTNKFFDLTITTSSNTNTQTITNWKIKKEDLQKYKKELYLRDLKNTTSTSYKNNYYLLLTSIASAKFLLENNYQELLEYLKTRIIYGQNSFIAWENSVNTYLTDKSITDNNTVSNMLKGDELYINIDNKFNSDYVYKQANTTTTTPNNQATTQSGIIDNNKNSAFGYTTSYYNVVSGMLGYKGIQTSTTNSFNTALNERLFTNDRIENTNGVGALYGYESKDKMKSYVDSISTKVQLENVVNDIAGKIKNLDLSTYNDPKLSFSQKKEEFKKILDNAQLNDSMFQARKTYISDKQDKLIPIKENPFLQTGAAVIQINRKDLESKESLAKALTHTFVANTNNGKATNGVVDSQEVIFNLLAEAARDSNVQNKMLNKISVNNKVTVYDKRANNNLDSYWVSNWKSKDEETTN